MQDKVKEGDTPALPREERIHTSTSTRPQTCQAQRVNSKRSGQTEREKEEDGFGCSELFSATLGQGKPQDPSLWL